MPEIVTYAIMALGDSIYYHVTRSNESLYLGTDENTAADVYYNATNPNQQTEVTQ
jgi:hypothetical protein